MSVSSARSGVAGMGAPALFRVGGRPQAPATADGSRWAYGRRAETVPYLVGHAFGRVLDLRSVLEGKLPGGGVDQARRSHSQ